MSHQLLCPHCQTALEKQNYKNIPSDVCPKCEGVWLDVEELDVLEDQVMDDDELKSSIVLESTESDRKCPICHTNLKSFHYRMYNEVELDFCPNKHGWFLDKGEADKVQEMMDKEEAGNDKTKKAEEQWIEHLYLLKNPSIINKIVGFFYDFKTS